MTAGSVGSDADPDAVTAGAAVSMAPPVPAALASFLTTVVDATVRVLASDLMGVYAVGSTASGDAGANSDVDVLVVADEASGDRRDELAQAVLPVAATCPRRGLEYVVYACDALRRPGYPLPFLLNLNAGPRMPTRNSHGGDPEHWFLLDVAMARTCSVPLLGPPLRDVVGPVPRCDVLRALADSVSWHRTSAATADAVLNACRAWRFADEGRWSSKSAASSWALARGRCDVVAAALRRREDSSSDGRPLPPADAAAFLDAVERRIASARESCRRR